MEVRLEGLSKHFNKVVAVDALTLTIEDGKLIGLLGPSGCGKSTTLFMLAGLYDPSGGAIYFGDEEVTRVAPEKRGIGLVFQNYALYPHMTVLDNVLFPLINLKIPKNEAKKMAYEMTELVQISELLNRKPKELSGGQQQRVAIARALVKKPRLLLLDEPLSNLDARLRIETREEIRRIQQEVHITTVFVTHDQEEAMSISDKIAVLDKGVLQQYEEPQQMYKRPANRFVAKFMGTPAINLLEAEVNNGELRCNSVVLRRTPALADGPVAIGIRPESFKVVEQGFTIFVDTVEVIGRDLIVSFELNRQKVKALIDSDHRIRPGDTLQIEIKEGHILHFDRVTQQLIEAI